MDQKIKERYNETILQVAMQRYGIAGDQIRALDAFESFIYAFTRGAEEYILRISHSLRRSEALIQGEVDWINYLATNGVAAARAIQSAQDQLVEAIADAQGGYFLATAFVKARGESPWERWTPTLYESYGRLLGNMHRLAQTYQPTEPAWRRPNWDDPAMQFAQRYLPASEAIALQKYTNLCRHLYTLPTEPAVYGLIHQDAHGSNFLVDAAGTITLFDFDECVYSWYVNDIAIALFYISMDATDPVAFTQEFMSAFLRGYQQVYRLAPAWLQEIPNFLKIREIELYAVIHRDFDVNNIDHWWCARFMHGRKAKIEQDTPFIDFDFATLATHLESN